MNNKVNVDLIVPSIEKRFNLFIPVNKKTIEVIFLINKAINEMTMGEFPINESLSLVDGYSGNPYDPSKNIKDNKILNGSKLILM